MKGKGITLLNCVWLTLSVLVTFQYSLWAQNNRADSLSEIIRSQSGKEKIKSIILLSDKLTLTNMEDAESLALQAIRLSDSIQDKTLFLEALYNLSVVYLENNQPEKARELLEQVIDLAAKGRNMNYTILAQIQYSEYFFKQSKLDSATHYLEMAKNTALAKGFDGHSAVIYNNEAKIADTRGDRLMAIELYLLSVDYYNKENNTGKKAVLLNNIGTLHMSLGNYDRAVKFLEEAATINLTENRSVNLNMNYSNLGVLYKKMDSLEQAKEYYMKSLALSKKLNSEFDLARVFMNLGNLFVKQNKMDLAECYFDSSLTLCKKNELAYGILLNQINLGGVLIERGKYTDGINKLIACEREVKSWDLPEQEAEVYRLLSEGYEKEKQFHQSLTYYKQYALLKDSIGGAQTNATILELQTKFEQEKKTREIESLRNQVVSVTAANRKYVIGLLVTLIVILLGGSGFLLQHRKNLFIRRLSEQQKFQHKSEMRARDKELVSKAIQVARLNEVIFDVDQQIRKLMPSLAVENAVVLDQIILNLKSGMPAVAWKEFETRFEQVHDSFYKSLAEACPNLTPTELKICSFIRLNLNTKDIALLTNRSISTIENTRSTIRKKMQLELDVNLTSYLLSL